MKRVHTLVAGAFLAVLILSACSLPEEAAELRFALVEKGTLGYEVDGPAVTIETRNLQFWNPPGAIGLTVLQYRIAFFDDAGAPIQGAGVSVPDNEQTAPVGLYVPGGFRCTTTDPELGCTVGDPGWRAAPGPVVVSQAFQLLPGAIAIQHVLEGFPVGWYAALEFDIVNANGKTWTTPTYQVAITAPN